MRRELERITTQANKVEVVHRMAVAIAGIVEDKSKITKEEFLKAAKKVSSDISWWGHTTKILQKKTCT